MPKGTGDPRGSCAGYGHPQRLQWGKHRDARSVRAWRARHCSRTRRSVRGGGCRHSALHEKRSKVTYQNQKPDDNAHNNIRHKSSPPTRNHSTRLSPKTAMKSKWRHDRCCLGGWNVGEVAT